ncbi:hypothetical protein OG943_33655 [Amycolatopsis sp. NBC_00345]|uniref:hypothetical protein n=1 Tax=Amycolatopsis sp. NBC_00345 TaxID=2975955 RepID=UPI002E27120E
MSGQQIYDNFANAVGPDGLAHAADCVTEIQGRYDDRATEIRSLATAMEEGWVGDAAGAASRGAGPLAVEHAHAAGAATLAQAGLTTQASAWHSVKAKVQPVPPVPQAPPPMSGFFGLQSAIDADIEGKTQQSNNVATANVAAMKSWSAASDETGRLMPTSYGQIDPNAMNISTTQAPAVHGPTGHSGSTGGAIQSGHVAGSTASHGGDAFAPGAGTTTSGPSSVHGSAASPSTAGSGGDQSTVPNSYVAPSAQTGLDPGGASNTPGLYRSGILDPNPQGSQGGSGSWNPSGLAVGGAGGTGSFGAGTGSGGRPGDNALGGGRGSGIGASSETAASRGPGGATSSQSGRPGSGGVGGMGAGRKGEEDEEHERKYIQSDDELFLAADDGQRLVDPQTGMAASPAVIGEAPKKRV